MIEWKEKYAVFHCEIIYAKLPYAIGRKNLVYSCLRLWSAPILIWSVLCFPCNRFDFPSLFLWIFDETPKFMSYHQNQAWNWNWLSRKFFRSFYLDFAHATIFILSLVGVGWPPQHPPAKMSKMTDSKYFTTTKKGEIFELKAELNSDRKEKKKEAVKKVIASMTVGKDVRWRKMKSK